MNLPARKRFAAILLAAVFASFGGAAGAALGTCGQIARF